MGKKNIIYHHTKGLSIYTGITLTWTSSFPVYPIYFSYSAILFRHHIQLRSLKITVHLIGSFATKNTNLSKFLPSK